MEQNVQDDDEFPELSSSPVVRNNRGRKKQGKKKSSASKVGTEENEVTSTTDEAETKKSKDNRSMSDLGDVPSPVSHCEEAILLEADVEVNNYELKIAASNNIKEKIVLCVDTFNDPNGSPFVFSNGKQYTTLTMIQRILTVFLHLKSTINKKHEFALIELEGENAYWRNDFTNDIKEVLTSLEHILPTPIEHASFDLTSLFDIVKEKALPPKMSEALKTPSPPCVIRVIVLYSRSKCIPEFSSGTDTFQFWSEFSTSCFLDTLYIHENASATNNCQKIYEALHGIETESSFSYQVIRSASNLHNCMAKLLAHPLQRLDSRRATFKVEAVDVETNGFP